MKLMFFDCNKRDNPDNGLVLATKESALAKIDVHTQREPHFVELVGDHGYKLLIGLNRDSGCVQFSKTDGSPPYLMALEREKEEKELEEHEQTFFMGHTATPIDARFYLTLETIKSIVGCFSTTGDIRSAAIWEEI